MLDGLGAALPIRAFVLAPSVFAVVLGFDSGNRIGAFQPAPEVDIGAALGAEGAKPRLLRVLTKSAATNRAKAGVGHLMRTPIHPSVSTSKFSRRCSVLGSKRIRATPR